eukprot:scaffold1704_cov246-Pinguiococcus_pyrenoidosus.AAC.4
MIHRLPSAAPLKLVPTSSAGRPAGVPASELGLEIPSRRAGCHVETAVGDAAGAAAAPALASRLGAGVPDTREDPSRGGIPAGPATQRGLRERGSAGWRGCPSCSGPGGFVLCPHWGRPCIPPAPCKFVLRGAYDLLVPGLATAPPAPPLACRSARARLAVRRFATCSSAEGNPWRLPADRGGTAAAPGRTVWRHRAGRPSASWVAGASGRVAPAPSVRALFPTRAAVAHGPCALDPRRNGPSAPDLCSDLTWPVQRLSGWICRSRWPPPARPAPAGGSWWSCRRAERSARCLGRTDWPPADP